MQTLALALQRTGDSCFVLSYVLLFVKTTTPSGVAGVSLRTHELYLFNFVLRYIDVFWNFLSLYLTCIKITFLCLGVMTIACFRCTARGRETYAEELELSYRSCLYYIVTPCVLAGLIWNLDPSSPFEIGWAISRWLEALAIVPQLVLLRKRGFVDNITSHYILLLGVFRIFYSVSSGTSRSVTIGSRSCGQLVRCRACCTLICSYSTSGTNAVWAHAAADTACLSRPALVPRWRCSKDHFSMKESRSWRKRSLC